ncbi:MAG: glucosidase [Kofleriaceae bacterium]
MTSSTTTAAGAAITTAEQQRLAEDARGEQPWKRWGPYLSERQWGTVREDYSPHGTAWEYLSHDAARSRAYRWGEDGIAGLCDDRQLLCLAVALWNGHDPILKERLFGLTNREGNHGEDVKELYYYLDATPTSSYLEMLYKYPQRAFPYAALVDGNRRRGKDQPELELVDTGIFDEHRYFDVVVEYAKAAANDLLMRITVHNRGPEAARIDVLPQLWFRNTWSWTEAAVKPELRAVGARVVGAHHPELGSYQLHCEEGAALLFCDNDTNVARLFGADASGGSGYSKDAFHEHVVAQRHGAVNPRQVGTKAAAHYALTVPAGGATQLRLRLTDAPSSPAPFGDFDAVVALRQREADEFYAALQVALPDAERRNVQRQAFAGLLWSKQFYYYDVPQWLHGDPAQPPPPPERLHGRNHDWQHLNNADVISMPDTWEYPWYAAWDLAFHCIPLALIDPAFAKAQLVLLTREWYMHPNGQLPAYEWAFGDVNPPVHAWAAWRVFEIDRKRHGGAGDLAFLERILHKLMLNFTWWVNRKDLDNNSIFQGGFLGLDNVGVFDRSAPLPTGGHINQSDGTSWMAMYSLNLMRIALELAQHDPVYEDIATKFFEHFLQIAAAMSSMTDEGSGLWDEQDEFFYSVLKLPTGERLPLRLRSMVGLVPLFAVETLEPQLLDKVPEFRKRLEWFLDHRPDLARLVSRWFEPGRGERRLLSLLRGHRMKCVLRRMLDETEFLSPNGVRSLSRQYLEHPYVFTEHGQSFSVSYQPAESTSGVFGGNSNWRGPVWFPMNFLIIESLQKFHHYYGDAFRIEHPTGSGNLLTLDAVADELTHRLTRIFLPGTGGARGSALCHGPYADDPHFRDHVLFHEYFDGDDGHGLGASHQTGWTGLVAKLLQPRSRSSHH